MVERSLRLDDPLAMRATLGGLQQGAYDPCVKWMGPVLWRATRTPEGPVTTSVEKTAPDRALMRAWGPGADWSTSRLGALLGEGQDASPFGHATVDDALHMLPGVRVPATGAVFEATVFTVLAQRVTSMEAVGAWRRLVWHFHETAPLPEGGPQLLLPPDPEQVAGLPSWALHRMGVERKRAEALRVVARCARRLEECVDLAPSDAIKRLMALPGCGVWTANEVAQVALGDVDAVSIGDFHVANHIGWALAGKVRSTDDEMMELLEPFAPRRGLAAKLLMRSSSRAPAFGPRYSPLPIASM